jgi:hypothetical protein
LIDDRKAGKSKSYHGSDEKDLLDLLMAEEFYTK